LRGEKSKMRKLFKFFDANGYEWVYNSTQGRIYLKDAEKEMPKGENGYPAHSLEDAVNMLIEDGYMTREKKKTNKV
jgi:hypothetical protein